MPVISRFFGITIRMFHNDHNPPHFHVVYNEYKALLSIDDLQILSGTLPKRVISMVLEWAFQHRDELKEEWKLAQEHKSLFWIDPLE